MGRIKTANIANKQALNRKVPISASNSVSVGIKGANGHYRELIIEGVDPALVLSNMDPEAVLANIRGLLQLGIDPSSWLVVCMTLKSILISISYENRLD